MPSPIAAGFAKRVNEYVTGRPGYPPELLAALPPAATIVELGAGTGKFTQLLIGRAKRIVAVELLAEMAAHIPHGAGTGVEVLNARAESVPLPDSTADLVCCATAYHWFDYPEAANEIHRLLKHGGRLALIWNRRDTRTPWVAELSELFEAYRDSHGQEARRFGDDYWRQILGDKRFTLEAERQFPFSQPMPPEGIYDRVFSTSYMALLPPDEQARVREKVAAMIARHGELKDAAEIAFPYVSLLYLLRKV